MSEITPWKDRLADFLDRALGRLVVDAVGYFGGDWLTCARIENIIALVNKTEERLAEKGVTSTRPILLKHLHPILEEASLEEDGDIRSLWARLLAEALDPQGVEVDKVYIGVLKELRPRDAALLDFMWAHRTVHVNKTMDGKVHKIDVGHLIPFNARNLSYVANADDRTIRHLYRLGLIKPSPVKREVLRPRGLRLGGRDEEPFERVTEEFYSDLDEVKFTDFGVEFCRALMGMPAATQKQQSA